MKNKILQFILTISIVAALSTSCTGLFEYIREAQQRGKEQNEATYKVVFSDEDTNETNVSEKKSRKKKNNQTDEKSSDYKTFEDKWNITLNGTEDLQLLAEIDSWLGTPYKYGGTSKEGTDCSGMVLTIYKKLYNIDTKRSAYDLWQQSSSVKRDQLKDGDLVFFKINFKQVSHVGIYIANGYFVHATSSRGVIIDHLDTKYYADRFANGGRVNNMQ